MALMFEAPFGRIIKNKKFDLQEKPFTLVSRISVFLRAEKLTIEVFLM
jgi:hypothetical protein